MIAGAPSTSAPQNYLGGIALRRTAVLSLALMFVLVKLIVASGGHILESLFWRQALVIPVVFAWAITHGGVASLKTQRIGAHARRAAMGLIGMACNFGGKIGRAHV